MTLTALATAAAWPVLEGRSKLFLEADADGGSLALRYQLPTEPGLSSLAAAARPGLDREQLWQHAQVLPGGLPVVVGPDIPDEAAAVLQGIGRDLAGWLAGLNDVDVIADLGRLSASSPALNLARVASAVLVVARPVATQLQPSAQRMAALANQLGSRVGWVLIGDKPYSADQVANAYGFPVARVLPFDSRAAQALEEGTNPGRVRRSGLLREVTSMAQAMASWMGTQRPAALPPAPLSPSSGGLSGRNRGARGPGTRWDTPSANQAVGFPPSAYSPDGTEPPIASVPPPGVPIAPTQQAAASPPAAPPGDEDEMKISPAMRAALDPLPDQYT